MLLMQAQENGVTLDEEQLLFITGGQDNAVNEDVDEQPVQDLALNVDNVFQVDYCNAFDYDVDEAPTAQTMFMVNISSVDPVYDEAGPSYDLNILSEVHDHDHYQDAVCKHHEVHKMHDDVQPNYVVDSHADYMSDSNMIPYDQYVNDNAVPVVESNELQSVKMQLASTINHNKSMVEEVMSLKKDFKQKENKYLEEFLDMKALKEKVEDKLYKQDHSLQTVHMLCKPKPYYDEQYKVAIGYKNPLCLTCRKQVQLALYNGHEIINTNHLPAIVHNSEDTPKIAKITRKKMNEKMNDPESVKKRYAIDIEPIPPHIRNNKEVHLDYLKQLKESVETFLEIVEEAKTMHQTNEPAIPSIGVNGATVASGSKPRSNTKKDMTLQSKSDMQKVEVHPRNNKSSVKQKNRVDSSISYKRTVKQVWQATGKLFAIVGYQWRPTGPQHGDPMYETLHICLVSNACRTDRPLVFGLRLFKTYDEDRSRLKNFVKSSSGQLDSGMTTLVLSWVEDMMKSSLICLLSKASNTKSCLWHRRLNHLNFGTINDLARKDLVRGLPRLKFKKYHLYFACQLGKSKKHTHSPKTENTNLEVLNTIHMDLCGPMRVKTINGKKYILVIIDDYTRFTWVKFLRLKNETPKAPMFLWVEAVATACYTQNRSLIYTRHNKTPYELVHNKKPDLTFLRVFGALCYPTNDNEDLGKLQPTADIGFFIGYAPRPTPTFLTPRQISLGLVPNLVPAAPYVSPTNKELEILFQPMFDEYLEPPYFERPVSPALAILVPVNSAGTPSSTSID
nr:hypothetical protein [Tanacetum cinerariifolium]